MTADILSPNWSALVRGWMAQGVSPSNIHADMRRHGLGLGLSPRWSQPNQLQKYGSGEKFGSHADHFEPGSQQYAREAHVDGQRTWTFMVYLNAPKSGGETHCGRLGRTFTPTTGLALIWNNLTAEGDPNRWTEHEGMAVEAGEKYIVTKWYRDKGAGPLFMEESNAA